MTIEEKIEEERAALRSDGLIPVTKETFFEWKAKRAEKRQKELEDKMKLAQDDKAIKKAAQKGKNSIMNGRALFTYNPDLFEDEEGAAAEYEEEKEGEEEKVDESLFGGENAEAEEDVDFD